MYAFGQSEESQGGGGGAPLAVARAPVPRFDFATDLAEEIGTPRWWRGLGVMLAGIGVALVCIPGRGPLPAPAAMHMDGAALDEWRSLTLRPLSNGADMGAHMGASPMVSSIANAPERPRITLNATLADGDRLNALLARAGVGATEQAAALALIGSAVPVGEIAPGTGFAITLGYPDANHRRPLEALKFRARFDLDLAITRGAGGLALSRQPIAVDSTPLRIRGVTGPSLYRAARAGGAPMKAIEQFLAAIDAHFSLDDVAPGDTFDLVVAQKRSAHGEVQVGDLLYAGIEHDGRPRAQLVRWGKEGQFFNAANMNEARVSNALILPVAGARITSSFGMRYHPILGYSRMHSGTDLAAPWGSPIYAVADAVVTYAGGRSGYGNYVKLDHGGDLATAYGHMSRIAVAPGMRVRAGQVIGYVGSTGLSTGPHLHYEVFRNGWSVDPMSVHFVVKAGVDKAELAAFRARLAELMKIRVGAH